MPEILFIATDPSVLTLIGNLEPLIEPKIRVETDYTGGINRIFDRHPAVVFLQNRIGKVTCDKLANQVKMLLDGEAVPLVLLSEEPVDSYNPVATYEACFDLCLPSEELSRQVQQLLRTLPGIDWKESAAAAPPVETGAKSGFLEITLPSGVEEFSSRLPWQDEDAGSTDDNAPSPANGSAPSPYDASAPSATHDSATVPADDNTFMVLEGFDSNEEDPEFTVDFLNDPFGAGPFTLSFEAASLQDELRLPAPEPKSAAVPQKSSFADHRRIEKADLGQLFGSMSESRAEPSLHQPKPISPQKPIEPSHPRAAVSAAGPGKTSKAKKAERTTVPSGSLRQPVQTIAEAVESGFAAGDDLPDSVAATLGIKKKGFRINRGLALCALLVFCSAAVELVFLRHRVTATPASTATHPASAQPAAQQLPQFIPQVAPDAAYGASHPGWERYQADALEYLVYREKGRIRAIQVLSGARGAITLPFLKTCLRLSTGHEQFAVKQTEMRSGLQVSTGALRNGGEVVIYRESPEGEIRGFVLSFVEQ